MRTKLILMIAMVFLVGALVYLIYTTNPKQIAPLSGLVIDEKEFLFEFENAGEVVIATDENFSFPVVLKSGSKIELPPGTYYWKIKGLFGESGVRNFTILRKVSLNFEEKKESFAIGNTGNVDLNVTKKTRKGMVSFIIEIGEEEEIEKENTSLEARENEA